MDQKTQENPKTNSLLNKIPVLDKGYASLVGSTLSTKEARLVCDELYKGQTPSHMNDMCHAVFALKMPLFVQLNLAKFNIKLHDTIVEEVDAFCPNEGEIASGDLETSRLISDDIKRTTDALLINPHAYIADGCDRFMAQVIMPISIYNTVIATGSLSEWYKFCHQRNAPSSVQSYMDTVWDLIKAEWEHVTKKR